MGCLLTGGHHDTRTGGADGCRASRPPGSPFGTPAAIAGRCRNMAPRPRQATVRPAGASRPPGGARMNRVRPSRLFAAVAAAFALGLSAGAAAYPDKPVQYIIPFPAGGESDIAARLQAVTFRQKFKQEMIVVNRAGRRRRAGLAAAQRLPERRLHDRRHQPAAHRAAAARGHRELQDRRHDAGVLLPLHARRADRAADSPFKTFQDFVKAAKDKPGDAERSPARRSTPRTTSRTRS